MTHTLQKYDRKDYGDHTTLCGRVLGIDDKHSFSLEKITCRKCKNKLIDNLIDKSIIKINSLENMLEKVNDRKTIDKLSLDIVNEEDKIKHYKSFL